MFKKLEDENAQRAAAEAKIRASSLESHLTTIRDQHNRLIQAYTSAGGRLIINAVLEFIKLRPSKDKIELLGSQFDKKANDTSSFYRHERIHNLKHLFAVLEGNHRKDDNLFGYIVGPFHRSRHEIFLSKVSISLKRGYRSDYDSSQDIGISIEITKDGVTVNGEIVGTIDELINKITEIESGKDYKNVFV